MEPAGRARASGDSREAEPFLEEAYKEASGDIPPEEASCLGAASDQAARTCSVPGQGRNPGAARGNPADKVRDGEDSQGEQDTDGRRDREASAPGASDQAAWEYRTATVQIV